MINPIIPIPVMAVICVGLICLKRRGTIPFIRQIIAVILLFMINLRIMTGGHEITVGVQKLNLKVVFVVDSTLSMLAEDYNGVEQRLEGVRRDAEHIVDAFTGADFAVITFNNDANVITPFTDNSNHVVNVINAITPVNELYARGTSLNVSHDLLKDVLSSAYNKENGDIVVFYISDGEITDDSKLVSFSDMSRYISGGAVMGYGTTNGGVMNVPDYDGNLQPIMDYSEYPSKPAVSKLSEGTLNSIAKDLNISYIHMTAQSKIDPVLDQIREHCQASLEGSEEVDKKIEGMDDTYYWFAIPLLALILYDAVIFALRKKNRSGKDPKESAGVKDTLAGNEQ